MRAWRAKEIVVDKAAGEVVVRLDCGEATWADGTGVLPHSWLGEAAMAPCGYVAVENSD